MRDHGVTPCKGVHVAIITPTEHARDGNSGTVERGKDQLLSLPQALVAEFELAETVIRVGIYSGIVEDEVGSADVENGLELVFER